MPAWEYCTLEVAVKKASSNLSLNKIANEEGEYPVFGAKGFVTNISFFHQEEEYLAIIKDGAGIGRVSKYPSKSSILATMQYLVPNEAFDIDFIRYFLMGVDFQEYRTGSTIPHIYFKDYKSLMLPDISIPEQQRIVAILDQAFADIEKARANAKKKLKNARELFDSYLNQVFSQRGEGWVERTLGEISERVSVGHVGSTTEFYCDANIGVPFIRSQNVRPYGTEIKRIKYITQEFHNSLKKSQLQSGDLLFVRVGANRGDCCALREFQGELNCANIVFARPRGPSIDFLEYFCNSPIGQTSLLGMTTGAAQGVINTKSVAQLKIPLPNREQQSKIVDSIDCLRMQAEQLEDICVNKINSLDELKKSLLQKAFSGELTKTEGMVA